MLDILIPTVSQGLLWSLLALGVYITFRVLDIADLSVEGTFPLGAAVAASCIASGHSLVTAFALAVAAGCAAGAVTGLLTTKLRIPALLSGILTMIGLYSVNLRVMGRANLSLLGSDTVYSLGTSAGLTEVQSTLLVGVIAVAAVTGLIYWFFGTEIGLAIRATGFNPQMSRAQGVNTDSMVVLGLLLSNGLVALSGALVAQSNGFADAGMGIGTIVIGLASVIIGEVLFGTRSFKNCLISVILGSIVYRLVIAAVLEMGMPPNDLKLFTAILVALALSLPLIQSRLKALRHSSGRA
ncbi:ABC transporter permease [Mesosutterella sp. AGMB02718]|uniref:ABC transporter permease n=1 Tax=Mesosutterella faecium TaxID=2925194 RepID=A0ABT7IJB8_9BURK|nr:ABC transporter permease [Mesosutterella sp. AGMB02718]MDL2058466.1 ABC transporter permease [Mesosutterella sp. AGMB02718]